MCGKSPSRSAFSRANWRKSAFPLVPEGVAVGIDRFGASAPYRDLFAELGFTPEDVAERARALLSRI